MESCAGKCAGGGVPAAASRRWGDWLARAWGCLGDGMGNADASRQWAGPGKPLPLATSSVPSLGWGAPQSSPCQGHLVGAHQASCWAPSAVQPGGSLGRTGGSITELAAPRVLLASPTHSRLPWLCGPLCRHFSQGVDTCRGPLGADRWERKPGSCWA